MQAHDHSLRGVIRWTGTLPEAEGLIAGVELVRLVHVYMYMYMYMSCNFSFDLQVSPMDECGDGEWKGHRYFVTLPGRAFFCPATTLLPSTQSFNCNRMYA